MVCCIACTVLAEPQAVSENDFDLPEEFEKEEIVDFTPIATPTTAVDEITPEKTAGLQAKEIPQELDRPIRVGIFIGVKELYLLWGGEKVKITAAGKNIKIQSGNKSMEMESREFQNEDGSCLAVAQ